MLRPRLSPRLKNVPPARKRLFSLFGPRASSAKGAARETTLILFVIKLVFKCTQPDCRRSLRLNQSKVIYMNHNKLLQNFERQNLYFLFEVLLF